MKDGVEIRTAKSPIPNKQYSMSFLRMPDINTQSTLLAATSKCDIPHYRHM